jgi:hypothetical protein
MIWVLMAVGAAAVLYLIALAVVIPSLNQKATSRNRAVFAKCSQGPPTDDPG